MAGGGHQAAGLGNLPRHRVRVLAQHARRGGEQRGRTINYLSTQYLHNIYTVSTLSTQYLLQVWPHLAAPATSLAQELEPGLATMLADYHLSGFRWRHYAHILYQITHGIMF